MTPNPSNTDLIQAFELYNLMQAGVSVGVDDISYLEGQLVSVIEAVKNEAQQEYVEEETRNAGRP